jgi:ABC-type branched-subunit amino acid transport system substrate-binding protein
MHGIARFFSRAGMILAAIGTVEAAADKNAALELNNAKAAFEARNWPEAESRLSRLWDQTRASPLAEEAAVLLVDIYLRERKLDQADTAIQRFKRQFEASPQLPRVLYDQGLLALNKGLNADAARLFTFAALRARTQGVYDASSYGLRHLVEGGGLLPEELEAAWQSLARDPRLGPWLLEAIGDQRERLGHYQLAEAAYSDYLQRYPQSQEIIRVRGKLERLKSIPREERVVLLMAPFSGEFAEVGRALREGISLAFEEAKAGGMLVPSVRVLDDQGNMVQGVRDLRKILQAEGVDAILGPAMSDVAAGAAIELSAGKSSIPLITPTATTHGIASLGEGVFQLNVTTHVLGQRIAAYASDCLGLKEIAIVAPRSEYGFQLAEAFSETVRKKGGTIAALAYVDPDAADLSGPIQELRQKIAHHFFEKIRQQGLLFPDARQMRSYMADSTFSLGGIFIPAASGDEADKIASQIVFYKIRGQLLGSSGWYDKTLLLKSSEASQGAYFSVDFQDAPRTEAYLAFSRAFKNRWKHAPDRVSALSYDAARFLLDGMRRSSPSKMLIPALRETHVFPGVLGDIVFGDEGVNQNTALFRLEGKSFKEVPDCATPHAPLPFAPSPSGEGVSPGSGNK